MTRWAKLSESIHSSRDYAYLCDTDPLAGCLYLMACRAADPFAIISAGDPVLFKGSVCPYVTTATEARVIEVLDLLEKRGHIVRYTDDSGRGLLWLPSWHKHNPVNWTRIGAPEYRLPDCWEMPDLLKKFIKVHRDGYLCRWFREHAPGLLPHGARTAPRKAKKATTKPQTAPRRKAGETGRAKPNKTETDRNRPKRRKKHTDSDSDSDTKAEADTEAERRLGKGGVERAGARDNDSETAKEPFDFENDVDGGLSASVKQELHMRLGGLLRDRFKSSQHWTGGLADRWLSDLGAAVQAGDATLDQLESWLARTNTRPQVALMDDPMRWLRIMYARRAEQQRHGKRGASPHRMGVSDDHPAETRITKRRRPNEP